MLRLSKYERGVGEVCCSGQECETPLDPSSASATVVIVKLIQVSKELVA